MRPTHVDLHDWTGATATVIVQAPAELGFPAVRQQMRVGAMLLTVLNMRYPDVRCERLTVFNYEESTDAG